MAIAHVNTKDWIRIVTALNEARKRELGNLIPSNDELIPALRTAIGKDGGLVQNLVPVFGEPIRRAFDVFGDVLSEKYGEAYRDELWSRINQKEGS